MVNADSVIKFLDKGGTITTDELRSYLHKMETEAKNTGAEGFRRFLIDRIKAGKIRIQRRREQEFGQIVLDTAEYLYKMRRLRNGQELTEVSDDDSEKISSGKISKSDSGKEDKRFRGKEKISI